jgi:hypothetical protein
MLVVYSRLIAFKNQKMLAITTKMEKTAILFFDIFGDLKCMELF